MTATIEPGNVSGTVAAPPSKSMTQRAYAAALLHAGKTHILNAGKSADEQAAIQIIQQFGASVSEHNMRAEVESSGVHPVADTIHCGESGLAARLFTPIAALAAKPVTVAGEGSLLQRPMTGLEEAMRQLHVTLHHFNGYLPVTLQGPIIPGSIKVNAAGSSQLVSGLLFALSYAAASPIAIEVTGLQSKPYIDLTLEVLAHFGKPVRNDSYRTFYIDPAKREYKDTIEISIEGDWSSAAYFLVAGAIAGEITVTNLRQTSKQADRSILSVLQHAGAAISISDDSIVVKRSSLRAFEFDAADCPDLFPILSVLAACCDGESYIQGVDRLFHKESNRAESISEMLMNFDVPFSIEDNTLCVTGVRKLQGTVIDSFNDHRIVMAAAIGALKARSRVDIEGAEAVNKSYPGFFNDLGNCGLRCIFD